MSNFLIDTHVFLWLIFSPEKIPQKTLTQLADQTNQVSVSVISFWEISLKYRLGQLSLSGVLPNELPDLTQQMNIEIANISPDEFARFYQLPLIDEHKDPFDRLIIWQCISQQRVFISHDRRIEHYAPFGLNFLWG